MDRDHNADRFTFLVDLSGEWEEQLNLFGLFDRSREKETARGLYVAVVERAREAAFYEKMGVPDTVDGRFDMVALHVFLVLRRLKCDRDVTADLAQALFDLMFVDMDENLREMGVGDLAVGSRVKQMAKAFYGRVGAYEDGMAEGPEPLAAALRRNLFRNTDADPTNLVLMARYVEEQAAAMDAAEIETFLSGTVTFAPFSELFEMENY